MDRSSVCTVSEPHSPELSEMAHQPSVLGHSGLGRARDGACVVQL